MGCGVGVRLGARANPEIETAGSVSSVHASGIMEEGTGIARMQKFSQFILKRQIRQREHCTACAGEECLVWMVVCNVGLCARLCWEI